jgi:hypothetical protein
MRKEGGWKEKEEGMQDKRKVKRRPVQNGIRLNKRMSLWYRCEGKKEDRKRLGREERKG